MELKRVVSLKFCSVVFLLIFINVLLFVKDNLPLSRDSKIYDEMVTNSREYISKVNTAKEAAVAGYTEYIATHMVEGASEEEKEVVKAARILLMETADYVDNYNEKIDEKIKYCEQQMKSSIFREKKSFEYLNLLKTRADMSKVKGQALKLSNGIWLKQLLDFRYTVIILFLITLAVVYSFFNEQKTGLIYIVHASKNGRMLLFIRRVGILLLISLVTSVLLYMITAATSIALHGGMEGVMDLVSCDSAYMVSGYGMNRIEFCFVLALLSGLTCFALSMLAWLIMSFFPNNNIGLFLFVLLYGLEYILYLLISEKSIFRFFKYVNIAVFKDANAIFSVYKNWGYSWWITDVLQTHIVMVAVILVGATALCGYRYAGKYVRNSATMLERLLLRLQEFVMRVVEKSPSMIKEIYKILISQKIIILLAILIGFVTNIEVGNKVMYNMEMSYYKTFFDKAKGLAYGSELEGILKGYEEEYEQFADSLDEEDVNSSQKLAVRRSLLEYIIGKVDYVQKQNEAGIDAVIIMPYEYEWAFGTKQKENQMFLAFVCVTATILLCSTFYSYENKNGIMPLLRSMKERKKWCIKKYLAIWLLSAVFILITYGIYYFGLFHTYDMQELDFAAQSLEKFSELTPALSFRGFLIADMLIRLMSLFALSVIISIVVSRLNYVYSMLAGFAVIVPQLLYMLGIRSAEKWSLCTYIAAFPAWNEGWQWKCYIVLAVICVSAICLYYKKVLRWR